MPLALAHDATGDRKQRHPSTSHPCYARQPEATVSFLFEQALRVKCEKNPDLALLQAQWEYDRRLVADALQTVGWTFPHYSRHDVSHSNNILVQLARVLGQSRIERLSATDIWLMMEAAYQHDVGMVVTDEQAREWLRSPAFAAALDRLRYGEDAELARAAAFIAERPDLQTLPAEWPLDVRRALMLVLADYGRAQHARNAERIVRDPQSIGLFSPRTPLIPDRLFRVLATACAHHGRSFEDTMRLPEREAGLGTDEAHPRFVACMLRLGDLLDLDNGRFCPVMMKGFGALPPSSAAHFEKHAAIKHLELGPTRVEVEAECETYEAYEATEQWLTWLREELKSQMARWGEIVPHADLGALPSLGRISANLKGHVALEAGRRPRFEVDREAILTLVKGGNIYGRPEACIRELLQNAIDATILRLWRENWSTLRQEERDHLEPKDLRDALKPWPVRVRFDPHDMEEAPTKVRWRVSIADQGTGIAFDELRFIQYVGGSSKNQRKQRDMTHMPEWMHPSGVFGIGLQSVFLLTDRVDITTRHHETREVLKITLRNGQGSGTDGLVIRRVENEEATPIEVGTRVEFDVVRERAPDDFLAREASTWGATSRHLRTGSDDFEGQTPRLIASASRLATEFAKKSPVASFVDGKPTANDESQGATTHARYFDRPTGLTLGIRADLNRHKASHYYYRGAAVGNTEAHYGYDRGQWPQVDPLISIDCDINFGRATSILELNRDEFTLNGIAAVQARLDDALTRAFPRYIDVLRQGNLDPDQARELQAASLYAYLVGRYPQNMVGDEWRAIRLSGTKLTLGDISFAPVVEFSQVRAGSGVSIDPEGSATIKYSDHSKSAMTQDLVLQFLRKTYPMCTYKGATSRSDDYWIQALRSFRFSQDTSAEPVTVDGLRGLLQEISTTYRDLSTPRYSLPCAKRFGALAYHRDARVVANPIVGWIWPRMICPFVRTDHKSVALHNLAQLVEWTAQHAASGKRDPQEVAHTMWNFIVEADTLMIKEWKAYSLDEARHELARWIR